MKVFLDTNVLLSAFYGHGACAELYDHCLDDHILFTSDFVLEEFREKATHKFKFSPERLAKAVHHIRTFSVLVPEASLPHPICKDKDDDHIVAAALEAGAACIKPHPKNQGQSKWNEADKQGKPSGLENKKRDYKKIIGWPCSSGIYAFRNCAVFNRGIYDSLDKIRRRR